MNALRPVAPAALVAAAVLAAAGCGGGGGPKLYSLERTRSCLADEQGVSLRTDLDFVATTARGGAVRAALGRNVVTIAFGANEVDAVKLARGYRRVAGKRIPIDELLEVRRNAVLVWAMTPNERQASAVDRCLR